MNHKKELLRSLWPMGILDILLVYFWPTYPKYCSVLRYGVSASNTGHDPVVILTVLSPKRQQAGNL